MEPANPFRNELEAAHGRIAQLTAENAQLAHQQHQLKHALSVQQRQPIHPVPQQRPHGSPRAPDSALILTLLGGALAAITMAVLALTFFLRSPPHGRHSAAQTSEGIATATAQQRFASPPPRGATPRVGSEFDETPSRVGSHAANPKAPCNCTPGDPLCSCL